MDSKETCRKVVGQITLVRIGTSSLVVSRVICLKVPLIKKKTPVFGVFAKLRKATCLSVRMEQLGSLWADFH